jgi:hypothetical protein
MLQAFWTKTIDLRNLGTAPYDRGLMATLPKVVTPFVLLKAASFEALWYVILLSRALWGLYLCDIVTSVMWKKTGTHSRSKESFCSIVMPYLGIFKWKWILSQCFPLECLLLFTPGYLGNNVPQGHIHLHRVSDSVYCNARHNAFYGIGHRRPLSVFDCASHSE